MAIVESSRGTAFDDLDNDGDVDVVVLNANAAPSILRNDSVNPNSWCQIELRQPGPNTQALGAKVFVKYNNQQQRFDATAGRGYQSHFGSRISVGIPKGVVAATATVHWPDGIQQEFDLKLNALNKLDRER